MVLNEEPLGSGNGGRGLIRQGLTIIVESEIKWMRLVFVGCILPSGGGGDLK
jgi:hypothetical protein